jgi:hypothetical protein
MPGSAAVQGFTPDIRPRVCQCNLQQVLQRRAIGLWRPRPVQRDCAPNATRHSMCVGSASRGWHPAQHAARSLARRTPCASHCQHCGPGESPAVHVHMQACMQCHRVPRPLGSAGHATCITAAAAADGREQGKPQEVAPSHCRCCCEEAASSSILAPQCLLLHLGAVSAVPPTAPLNTLNTPFRLLLLALCARGASAVGQQADHHGGVVHLAPHGEHAEHQRPLHPCHPRHCSPVHANRRSSCMQCSEPLRRSSCGWRLHNAASAAGAAGAAAEWQLVWPCCWAHLQ